MIGAIAQLEKKKATKAANLKGGSKKFVGGYQIRVKTDLEELDDRWKSCLKNDSGELLNKFTLSLVPDDGIWKGHEHLFSFEIPNDYPIKPPKVLSKTLLYHPNIDPEGHICLNILREDWKPVLNLNAICTGLHFLFLDPNPSDPLDIEAADVFEKDKERFLRIAKNYMKGIKSKM